jgi:hypothetical protein
MVDFIRGGTRIYAAPAATAAGNLRSFNAAPAASAPPDNYLSALLKLIPTEIVAIYLAAKAAWVTNNALLYWFGLCLLACICLRAYSSMPRDSTEPAKPQWASVLVSSIAFVLWACAMGPPSPLGAYGLPEWAAGGIAGLFGILAPFLIPGDKQAGGKLAEGALADRTLVSDTSLKPLGRLRFDTLRPRATARQTNRGILHDIFDGDYPDDTGLDALGYGGEANSVLAANIIEHGVNVSPAAILVCGDIACVLKEMERVR